MTLAEISQIAVALGTLASIVYAGIQIRNNARAVRASTIQHFVSAFTSHWDEIARNPELSGLLLRGLDDFDALDRLEKMRFRFALTALMRRWENVWEHLKDGTLQEGDLPSTKSQEAIASAPGFWIAWELVKVQSGADFTRHVDKLIATQKAAAATKTSTPGWAHAGHALPKPPRKKRR